MNQDRVEIFIAGIGGQGVVYSANLIANAALLEYKYASAIAHYGPESRGSITTSEVVISTPANGNLDYPCVEAPDIFIAMHQRAYDEYIGKAKLSLSNLKYLVYDSTLVTINSALRTPHSELVALPASQLAKDKLGNIMMANIILTAALVKASGIISREHLEQTLRGQIIPNLSRPALAGKQMVSEKDYTLNRQAVEMGFEPVCRPPAAARAGDGNGTGR